MPLFLSPCREWVLKSSILIAMTIYTYLRLIVDHHGTAQLQALRQKEVDFCISLLRERVRMKREPCTDFVGELSQKGQVRCYMLACHPVH